MDIYIYIFYVSVNYVVIYKSDILNNHKYLMAKNHIIMFWLIKQVLIALTTFSVSLSTKYISLNNELYMISLKLIDINLIELNFHPFMNIPNNGIVQCNWCYLWKYMFRVTKDINVKVFNLIKRIYDTKKLIKDISCDCKFKLDSITCN